MTDPLDPKQLSAAPTTVSTKQTEEPAEKSDDKYKKHRWKFLVFGAVSGVLMGVYAPTPQAPGRWFGDLFGGMLLWYVLWWLWAWSRRRKDRNDA
jgi:hypothetical protein